MVIQTLEELEVPHGHFYKHCDCSRLGLMVPFVALSVSKLTFKEPIGSVSVSWHKFLKCKNAACVQLTSLEHADAISRVVKGLAYEGANIMNTSCCYGSVLNLLWDAFKEGYTVVREQVSNCLEKAEYLHGEISICGTFASRDRLSNTVVFDLPQVKKFPTDWNLSREGDEVFVMVRPNVTLKEMVKFVYEVQSLIGPSG
ncbi:hypothetical protein Sjap_018814 [Stephania japonica]|uniref:Uncharacterized protein n=1 Tax=Stephania japonica TaxID=461633 RepID=A0AAP0NLI5_9MAGN